MGETRSRFHRAGVVLGRRRPLGPARREALQNLLPAMGIRVEEIIPFLEKGNPSVLEIGFGSGEHLLDLYAHYPEGRFVGVDPYIPGVARLLLTIADKRERLRVFPGRAEDLEAIYKNTRWVDFVYVLFPDPWPKRRHTRRRLLQPSMCRYFGHALREGGKLFLAHDREDFLKWALSNLRDVGFCCESWGLDFPTRYAEKALGRGESIWTYACERKDRCLKKS